MDKDNVHWTFWMVSKWVRVEREYFLTQNFPHKIVSSYIVFWNFAKVPNTSCNPKPPSVFAASILFWNLIRKQNWSSGTDNRWKSLSDSFWCTSSTCPTSFCRALQPGEWWGGPTTAGERVNTLWPTYHPSIFHNRLGWLICYVSSMGFYIDNRCWLYFNTRVCVSN